MTVIVDKLVPVAESQNNSNLVNICFCRTMKSPNDGQQYHESEFLVRLLQSICAEVIDPIVELYLSQVIAPFLHYHEIFYTWLNQTLRTMMDDHTKHIPSWFTANFITYMRTLLIYPTLLILASGQYYFIAASLVVLADFGDFLDGVVARYWVDVNKNTKNQSSQDTKSPITSTEARTSSENNNSNTAIPPLPVVVLSSWVREQRVQSYGGFIDAVCDKVYVVPCWIILLTLVPTTRWQFIHYCTLLGLITAEIASAAIRFRAYYTNTGMSPPQTAQGLDFSTSAVKADHVGKAKQTFEMIGTAMYCIYYVRYLGLLLLMAALPLAYESIRRKIIPRVMFVLYDTSTLSSSNNNQINVSNIQVWSSIKALGSELVVGIPHGTPDQCIVHAQSCPAVDRVLVNVPSLPTILLMQQHQLDYYVASTPLVGLDDTLAKTKKCLILDPIENIVRLYTPKSADKTE
jgi:phosphatidylglycerophosphate synthase